MADEEGNLDLEKTGVEHPEVSPDIKPHLPSLERGEQDQDKPVTGASSIGGGGDSQPLSASGLSSAEKGGSAKTSGKPGPKSSKESAGDLWSPKDRSSRAGGKYGQAVKGAVTGHPKLVGGGVAGIIALFLLILFGFGNIGSLELSTIANRDIDYQSEPEQSEEESTARDMMAEEDCIEAEAACTASEEADLGLSSSEVSEAATSSDPLTTEMEKFSFTDPTIEPDLAKAGISVDTSDGKFTGLSDSSGTLTPTDIEDDTGGAFEKMEVGMPEWQFGQTVEFPTIMYDDAGSSFDVFPDTQTDTTPADDIDSAVLDGAPGAPGVVDTNPGETEDPQSQSPTPAEQTGAEDAGSASKTLVTAEDTVIKDVEGGESETKAIGDASSEDFDLGSSANLNVAVQDLCMVDEVATGASVARVPEIMTEEIRHATTLESMFSQEQDGSITGKEASAAVSIFNGNQSALLPGSTLPAEDAEPFTDSEEWQDAVGNVGAGTAIESAALPTVDEGTVIVGDIDQALADSGIGVAVCDVEDSPFGTIANAMGGVVTVFDDDVTLGAGEAATVGAVGGLQVFLTKTVIPDILKYFTPLAVSGAEDSVQWMNNTGAGMNMAYNNYDRRLGGLPLDTAAADAEEAAAVAYANNQYNHESWADRTLATSNPKSLVSQLSLDIPIGWQNILRTAANYLIRCPSIIFKHLADITLLTHVGAQPTPSNPGTPYETTQYGFNNNQVDLYNPIANEQYLYANVSYGGKSLSRISMLGNPNTYTDSPSGDNDKNDLLHCFVDSYSIIESANNGVFNPNQPPQNDTGADQNCGALGMYDNKDDPVNSTDVPNDQTVASIYCYGLVGSASNQSCINSLTSSNQVSNDVAHYGQYLMDLHVMGDYTSLTNNQ